MKAELLLEQPILPNALGVKTEGFPVCKFHKSFVMAPKGTVLEGPDVWQLARIGSCKPLDQECWDACGMTKEQLLKQHRYYVRLERGQVTGDPKYDAPDA